MMMTLVIHYYASARRMASVWTAGSVWPANWRKRNETKTAHRTQAQPDLEPSITHTVVWSLVF